MEVCGRVLIGFLGVLTKLMKHYCLVLGVAKDKSLVRRLEYANWSILKSPYFKYRDMNHRFYLVYL